MIETLTVALAERSYPIHVGTNLLRDVAGLLPAARHARAIVVTNATIASLHLDALQAGLSAAGLRHDAIVIPDGEEHKDWVTLHQIHTRLLELAAERSTLLIGLGAGTGDGLPRGFRGRGMGPKISAGRAGAFPLSLRGTLPVLACSSMYCVIRVCEDVWTMGSRIASRSAAWPSTRRSAARCCASCNLRR